MNRINSFEELRALPPSTIVLNILDGNYRSYIIGGTIRQSTGVIGINNDSLKDIKFLYNSDFKEGIWISDSDYDSKTIGQLMIDQIKAKTEKDIEAITEVYLKK